MLSKVSKEIFYGIEKETDTRLSSPWQVSSWSNKIILNLDLPNDGKYYKYNFSQWYDKPSWNWLFQKSIDGGDFENITKVVSGTAWVLNFSVAAKQNITIRFLNDSSGATYQLLFSGDNNNTYSLWFEKWYNIPLWKPRELKQIAQKATTTIFGVHTDNIRITQNAE